MAISSASTRIFKAEDPVMETDLQLLAKVNEYQQQKFDEGAQSLQNEVDNWSLLSNVAKPQDKEYINGKLNSLVSGIKNLGGVNLADPNNVNQLKSMGYNLYADEKVMAPVVTTKKMNQLAQDISAKTNGKDAKDYDSVYGEYLMNSYQSWLNDGQQGTGFGGPTSLPQGSFDNYNKKINDELNKLQPDLNSIPQDDKDAALNYYQVGDKFIKKDRVKAAIDAVTSAQDKSVLTAHAWKSMRNFSDSNLIAIQGSSYDSKIKEAQDNINDLNYKKSLTTDFKQKQLFTSQIGQLQNSIQQINGQKQNLTKLGTTLPKETRDELSSNLFYDSLKDQYGNARAYDQKTVELKSNSAAMFKVKQAQEDFWHGKDYDLKLKDFDLKNKEFDLKTKAEAFKEQESFAKLYGISSGAYGGLTGPSSNAPLSVVPVLGKDDATILGDKTITQADANYTATATKFYQQGYNYLMGKDPVLYENFLKQDPDGHWIPKDDKSTKIVNKALDSFKDLYGNIAGMSIKERNGLTLNDDDLSLFQQSQQLEEAGVYKDQIKDLTQGVFRAAGKDDPYSKTITVKLKGGINKTFTYAELKEMSDKKDPLLETLKANAVQGAGLNHELQKQQDDEISALNKRYNIGQRFTTEYQNKLAAIRNKYDVSQLGKAKETLVGIFSPYNSVDNAVNEVNNYYQGSDLDEAWKKFSETLNPYAQIVSLPKDKKGQINEQAAKILQDAIPDEKIKQDAALSDIDISKVWAKYDPETLSSQYMATIKYRRASGKPGSKEATGDKYVDVDLTNVVNQQQNAGGGWISGLYASDNEAVVAGLSLQKDGKTSFDPKTNFQGALQTHGNGLFTHKYQIVSVRDPKTNGVVGYKAFVAIPLGKDDSGKPKFQVIGVPNFSTVIGGDISGKVTTFPAVFEGVRKYLDLAFSTDQSTKDFYARLGIPYNQ